VSSNDRGDFTIGAVAACGKLIRVGWLSIESPLSRVACAPTAKCVRHARAPFGEVDHCA
jgi:hypothetical protein